jgi:prevent-host-death family protein
MITVGASEAKTHFSKLLEKVVSGEEVTITKYGKPIARLVSAGSGDRMEIGDAIEKLKTLRKGNFLNGLSGKELRDLGRP